MTEIDMDELRAVAKVEVDAAFANLRVAAMAASPEPWAIRGEVKSVADSVYLRTFVPPTVLALLDTIDNLRAEVARLQGADDGR